MIQPTKKQIFSFKTMAAVFMIVFVFAVVFFCYLDFVYAQDDLVSTTEAVGEATGLGSEDPRILVARIIQVFLGILGAVAIALVIYGGFLYMTSGGDPAKVDRAKKVLINAAIGLAIILLSFSIVSYIASVLLEATGVSAPGEGLEGGYQPPDLATGALGSVIQDHYPGVGMIVPRNTVIMVTFRESINPATILAEGYSCIDSADQPCEPSVQAIAEGASSCICQGDLKTTSVRIYRACDSVYTENAVIPDEYNYDQAKDNPQICNQWTGDEPSAEMLVAQGKVTITSDMRTFVFKPSNPLGSATQDIGYFVSLTNDIQLLNINQGVFSKFEGAGYRWNFTTNTTIDLTPPYITSISPATFADGQALPAAQGEEMERNKKIIITFNEPVAPLAYLTNGDNVNQEIIVLANNEIVAGYFETGINQYKSVVFRPTESCGGQIPLFNSCGDQIYCLPADSIIETTVHSVESDKLLNQEGPQISEIYPAGGIVDTAFNALDTDNKIGKGNGITEGSRDEIPNDDYIWSFKTSDALDLIPPVISSITPDIGADKDSGVTADVLVRAYFDQIIDPATATNKNLIIESDDWQGWYTGGMYCSEDSSLQECQTTVIINHSDFPQAQPDAEVPIIYPRILSGLQDDAGNCFNPCQGPQCENISSGENCIFDYEQ